jgi:hypothetical protein
MNAEFEARRNRLQQRHGNPRFSAGWQQSRDGEDKEQEARAAVARHLEVLTDPYQDEDYPNVKLMPLWHGTQRDKLGSLLSAGYGAFGDTDDGYFGKGIYATFHADYAQIYADKFGPVDLENGFLLFNWGITYNSRPVISSDYDENLGRLTWAPDHTRYDSHFVLVVPHPLKKGDYVPITPPEQHKFTEVVFFDTSQILPRYLVTLQPTLPNSPSSQISALLEALGARRKVIMMEADAKSRGVDALAQQLAATNRELAEHGRQAAAELAETARRAEQLAATNRELAATNDTQAQQLAEALRRAEAAERETKEAAARVPAILIPPIAQGFEAIYKRFLNGGLIYRPNPDNDAGRIDMLIRDLANPLEGTFDLSNCDDTGRYLSISTGYRKQVNPANAERVEIWIAPKFLIEKEFTARARHFRDIAGKWAPDATVGIFWAWGGDEDLASYDYLTDQRTDSLSQINLHENWRKSTCHIHSSCVVSGRASFGGGWKAASKNFYYKGF